MTERWRDRPTGDVLLLMVAGTVCLAVLCAGAGILALALVDDDADLSAPVKALTQVITVMLGAVVGYLGGRGHAIATERDHQRELDREPDA